MKFPAFFVMLLLLTARLAVSRRRGGVNNSQQLRADGSGQTTSPVFEVAGDLTLDGNQGCLYNAEGASSDLPLNRDPYTVEAWVLIGSDVSYSAIAGWGNWYTNSEANGFRFSNGPNGLQVYWWRNDVFGSFTPLDDGEFHHVASTFDGTTRSIFVDFALVASDTPSGGAAAQKDNFCVGNAHGSHTQFRGTMRDLKIWKSARTTSEMAAPPETSATGDPHIQNILGEHFDLKQPGIHTLASVPQGAHPKESLLRITARAEKFGDTCSDVYFEELNVTGKWAEANTQGGLRFDAGAGQSDNFARWIKVGPVDVKVVRGHQGDGTVYLNLFLKHLGTVGYTVGGLLGVDDHGAEEASLDNCIKRVFLSKVRRVGLDKKVGSVAHVES